MTLNKHIIFIGFKHVGKTALSKLVAEHLQQSLIDVDDHIETLYQEKTASRLNCREIMQLQGELFFRELEHQALVNILKMSPHIIATGGGTPLAEPNQQLLATQLIIHVTAPPEMVYERIMKNGQPAFFAASESPRTSFNNLWNERESIFKKLAHFTVDNDGDLTSAAAKIIHYLKQG